jgi:hypothetical protein
VMRPISNEDSISLVSLLWATIPDFAERQPRLLSLPGSLVFVNGKGFGSTVTTPSETSTENTRGIRRRVTDRPPQTHHHGSPGGADDHGWQTRSRTVGTGLLRRVRWSTEKAGTPRISRVRAQGLH